MTDRDPTSGRGKSRGAPHRGFGRLPDPMDRLRNNAPPTQFPTRAMGEAALYHVQNVVADTLPHLPVLGHTYTGPTAIEGREGVTIKTTYAPVRLDGARSMGDILRTGKGVDRDTALKVSEGLMGAARHLRGIDSTGGRLDPRTHDLLVLPDQPVPAMHVLEPGLTGYMIPHPDMRVAGDKTPVMEALVSLSLSAVRLRSLAPQAGRELAIELADTVASLGKHQDTRGLKYFQGLQARIGQSVERGDDAFLRELREDLRVARTDTFPGVAKPIRELTSPGDQVRYMLGILQQGPSTLEGRVWEGSAMAIGHDRGLLGNAEALCRDQRVLYEERDAEVRRMLGRGDDDDPGGARPVREPDGPGPRGGPGGRTPELGPERGTTRDIGERAIDLTKRSSGTKKDSRPPRDRNREERGLEARGPQQPSQGGGKPAPTQQVEVPQQAQEQAPQVQSQAPQQAPVARVVELEHGPEPGQAVAPSTTEQAATQQPVVARDEREPAVAERQPVERDQSPFSMQQLLAKGREEARANQGIIDSRKGAFEHKTPKTKEQEAIDRAREAARSAEVPAIVKEHSDQRFVDAQAARRDIRSRADTIVAQRGVDRTEALRLAEREHAREFGYDAPGDIAQRTTRSPELTRDAITRTRS